MSRQNRELAAWMRCARVVRLVSPTLLACAFLYVAIVAFSEARNLRLHHEATGWPRAKGLILQSSFHFSHYRHAHFRNSTALYHLDLIYSYQLEPGSSTYYESEGLCFDEIYEGLYEARRIAAQYPVGREVRVAYDPQHPTKSCLEPMRYDRGHGSLTLAFLALVAVIALTAALWVLWQASSRRT